MPYSIQQDGDNYNVLNEDGDVKAVHEPPDAKKKAEEQIKLLHALEHGMKEEDVNHG